MITRTDLNGKTPQEVENMLQEDIQAYAVSLESLGSEEDLLAREQELVHLMDVNDERIKTVMYSLPENCTFDNQTFSREKVASYIVDLLDKSEVEWSYTLGMYQMVQLWKNKELTEIQYNAYDSILRLLGGLKYKGFESWKKILIVNEFLSGCHEEYVRDYGYMVYLSQLHNAVLELLKKPEENMEGPAVEPAE